MFDVVYHTMQLPVCFLPQAHSGEPSGKPSRNTQPADLWLPKVVATRRESDA